MKKTILAVFFASSFAFCGPASQTWSQDDAAARGIADLHGGIYEVKIDGLLCTACTRAIVEELVKNEAVQIAIADFDNGQILVTVKLDKTLTASALRKALRRAAKRVDLGVKFAVKAVVYRPTL